MIKETKRLLALDLASKCGYAFVDIVGRTKPAVNPAFAGWWDLRPKPGESRGMRFIRFENYIIEVGPDMIVSEAVKGPFRSSPAALLQGGLASTLAVYCEKNDIPYADVPVGTIKRRATGKGNAKKEDMIEAANREFAAGLDVKNVGKGDDDVADALWICQIAIEDFAKIWYE